MLFFGDIFNFLGPCMRISFCCTDTKAQPWLDGLRAAFPGAEVEVWSAGALPAAHPFWTHPKITVTPHTSARTLREESIAQIARKITALQRGEPVAGVAPSGAAALIQPAPAHFPLSVQGLVSIG